MVSVSSAYEAVDGEMARLKTFCTVRTIVLYAVATVLGLLGFYLFIVPPIAGTFTYHFENGQALASIVGMYDERVLATRTHAAEYYEQQRPYFEKAAREFVLHPYFNRTAKYFSRDDRTFYDLVEKRLTAMAELLEEDGRDDFAIEKSKCVMNDFHERNGLPIPRLLGNWTNRTIFLREMKSGRALAHVKQWPVFVKFCHLTQGSADSVRRIKSQAWLNEQWKTFEEWFDSKWDFASDDWTRPWRAASNTLCRGLDKGVFVQAAADLTYDKNAQEWRVLEVKIEVLWGRPYLGILFPQSAGARGGDSHFITRNPDGTFKETVYQGYFDLYAHRGVPIESYPHKDDWYRWAFEEGQLECAWNLAARTAKIIGVDEMRFDIFLAQGHPHGCQLNENSLSSGHPYGGHGEYLSKLWLQPHMARSFQVASHRERSKIYETRRSDHRQHHGSSSTRRTSKERSAHAIADDSKTASQASSLSHVRVQTRTRGHSSSHGSGHADSL